MEPSEQQHSKRYLLTLSLGALGIYIPPYLADWYRAAARMLG